MELLKKSDFDGVFALMEKSFPSDEHRPYDEQKALLADPRYELYGEKRDEKVVGFIAAWRFCDFFYIEHFAVDPSLRGGGIGSGMISQLVAAQNVPSVLEVELPESEICRRRIGFYRRNGFVYNDYGYIQPPISKGKSPVPLRIMSSQNAISREKFEMVRDILYREVYRAPVPNASVTL